MKKGAGLLPFLLVMIASCHGQSTPREKNDSVLALLKIYLREKSVDSLYALTGAHFLQGRIFIGHLHADHRAGFAG
jgi:hypothetical protein